MAPVKDAWDRFYSTTTPPWRGPNFDLPKLGPCSRVLDIGCGPGSMLVKGAEAGHRMVGLDLSPSALSMARAKLDARHLDADLIEGSFPGDAGNLGRFDCILLHHLLSSLDRDERMAAVSASLRLLDGDGCVSFLDLSVNDMRFGSGELIAEGTYLKGNGIREHFFTLDEVMGLFEGYRSNDVKEITWSQRTREGPRTRSRISGTFYAL